MSRYIFDTETDGLLPQLTTIHCVALFDLDTAELHSFADQPGHRPISEALRLLADAELLVGHNIIAFDIPAIKKVFPSWETKAVLRDTLICGRILWPHIAELDAAKRLKNPAYLPGNLVGAHSLKAWGLRMQYPKDEYTGGWERWSEAMHSYMCRDVQVTVRHWANITAKKCPERVFDMEHKFAQLIFMQQQHGFAFNAKAARKLCAKLVQRKCELEVELQAAFPPWYEGEVVTPKRDLARNRPDLGETPRFGKGGKLLGTQPVKEHYTEGVSYSKLELRTFNPGSRLDITNRLQALYGWKPKAFTEDGRAVVDEDVLNALPYKEAKLLAEYLMVQKRLGALAEGKNAWLQLERNGRIHGEVNTVGTPTARCTHSKPNITQVPSLANANGNVPYGYECRDLFIPSEGYVLVGGDASGLELRALAHYMAKYDGGAYGAELLTGDIHTANQVAAGLASRQNAKTFIYAFLYGAGDVKLGSIVAPLASEKEQAAIGKKLRAAFLKNVPALKSLIDAVKETAREKKQLKGIDGRPIHVRSQHSALNTLLQSCGAIAVKLATVYLYETLTARGWVFGKEWALVAHIHDELQAEVLPHLVEEYGRALVESIERAGADLALRIPLTGEFKHGSSWAKTH